MRNNPFLKSMQEEKLLYLGNDSLECFGVIHGQVGENLAVDLDSGLVQKTHQLRIAQQTDPLARVYTRREFWSRTVEYRLPV